jgi:hypothetical protein
LKDPNAPGEATDWVGRIFSASADEMLRMRKVALKWFRLVSGYETVLDLAVYPVAQ